jgi:predicted lipoprotein with Yx(FWY)xxD motif
MQSKLTFAGAVAALTLLAGCGGSPAGTTAATTPTPAATGTTISVATDAKLGQILVDASGKTVYLFVADTGTSSTCYTSCAAIWPPVVTTGAPKAGTGAQSSLLGTTARTDGTTEVTYAGHPLYYFIQDKAAGDTKGQGINGFGGLWWVVSPSGAAMH